jgi:hypothetical protein
MHAHEQAKSDPVFKTLRLKVKRETRLMKKNNQTNGQTTNCIFGKQNNEERDCNRRIVTIVQYRNTLLLVVTLVLYSVYIVLMMADATG